MFSMISPRFQPGAGKPLEIGIDSTCSFGYNDKNVCVNVYLGQYTRFSQGNP
jgi:hypothetical protein